MESSTPVHERHGPSVPASPLPDRECYVRGTEVVQELTAVPGTAYACVAHLATRRVLAESARPGSETATPEVVLAWSMQAVTVFDDGPAHALDDLMITSRRWYHVVRTLAAPDPSATILLYLCLDRGRSNLAAARRELAAPRLRQWLLPQPTLAPGAVPADRPVPLPRLPERAAVLPPSPAGPGPTDRAQPGDPLPRRRVPAPVPRPLPVTTPGGSVFARTWSTDMATMARLVTALRKLAS